VRRAVLAGSVCALGICVAAARPAPAASRRCEPKGSKVILRGSQALVFTLDRGFWGCVYRYHKPRVLRARPPFETPRLNGRFALYSMPSTYDEGADFVPAHAFVVDLRPPGTPGVPGRGSVHAFGTAGPGPAIDGEVANARNGVNPVTDAVVSAGGSAAWISKPPPTGGDYRIFKVDRHRPSDPTVPEIVDLVAAGPDIAPTSLGVSGRTIAWRQSSKRRTARLRH
jgi:hypothetical protein